VGEIALKVLKYIPKFVWMECHDTSFSSIIWLQSRRGIGEKEEDWWFVYILQRAEVAWSLGLGYIDGIIHG
jgi:hypothetical protein